MLAAVANTVGNYTLESAVSGTEIWNGVALLSASYDAGSRTAMIVTAAGDLTPSLKYRLTVTTGLRDKAGNYLVLNSFNPWKFYVSDVRSQIDWPYENNKVYGTIPVHGAADGSDAKHYKLQYEDAAVPGVWTTFGSTEDGLATPVTSLWLTETDWENPSQYSSKSNIDTTTIPGTIRLDKTSNSGAWYNSNWAARKRIDVFNPNPSGLINYQTKVVVNWAPDMKTDFSDLRFTQKDKVSLVDYWVESVDTGVSAVVWLEVPNMAPASTQELYVYYGQRGCVQRFECRQHIYQQLYLS